MVKKTLLLLLVAQTILSMDIVQKEVIKDIFFPYYFKALPFDLQRTIFHYIPNKFIFREINKEFATTWSVKSPEIFSNDLGGLDKPGIIKVILWASYQKNYVGIENILSKSSLLQLCPDKYIYYCYNTNKEGRKSAIDIHQMVIKYHKINNEFIPKRDETLRSLLKKYKIKKSKITDFFWATVVNKNIMACLVGDSDAITKKNNASFIKKERIKIALEVAVSCNNIKCIKKCLEISQTYKDYHYALENECSKLLDEMYAIVYQNPHLHTILDDCKGKGATIACEQLNKERKMTFFDWICTIC